MYFLYHTQDCTDIARDDVPLLVFSTLGGGLTAVDPITSEVKWRIEDGKNALNVFSFIIYYFVLNLVRY